MNKAEIITGIKRRRTWFIACGAFIPMVFLTIGAVACACNIGSMKAEVLFIAEMCVAVRMLIGLVLAENSWKAWFYLLLPIGLAVLTDVLSGITGH